MFASRNIMFADKYLSIFAHQMEGQIVNIFMYSLLRNMPVPSEIVRVKRYPRLPVKPSTKMTMTICRVLKNPKRSWTYENGIFKA